MGSLPFCIHSEKLVEFGVKPVDEAKAGQGEAGERRKVLPGVPPHREVTNRL